LISKNLFLQKIEKKDEKREKVIILLTDWDSTRWINPLLVAKMLKKELNIKIYTIWIWWRKKVLLKNKKWFIDIIPPLNDEVLKKISNITDWKFFRVTNNESFENIFKQLEKLEKNDIEVKIEKYNKDYYKPFILILFLFIFILFLFENKKY
jgi:Ca-activated chloride channel family protein